MIALLSLIVACVLLPPVCYLVLLAAAAVRPLPRPTAARPSNRFLIAIPAHDEEIVIPSTIRRLMGMDYPPELFSIHVVADHCSDNTAAAARQAGAFAHERKSGSRSGKGAALRWLFQLLLDDAECDAVVVFDSDTQVDRGFLRTMDARLSQGVAVIQGMHIISNPRAGWFPALTWAMFLVDNRFQNLGRSNLGLSGKNMGDSICFRKEVLRSIGWGEGLTEDFQLRQRLLLDGVNIAYEPAAKAYGEAPATWALARAQRARWLRGTSDSSQQFAWRLLVEGIRRRKIAMLDGALQAFFPSYSTLTLAASASLLAQVLAINWHAQLILPPALIGLWAGIVAVLLLYPYFGLFLEKAPIRAYLAIASGPFFILWRTWLALSVRFGRGSVTWIRTAHGQQNSGG